MATTFHTGAVTFEGGVRKGALNAFDTDAKSNDKKPLTTFIVATQCRTIPYVIVTFSNTILYQM